MSKHISRRLFLSGAALLGAGIALDRLDMPADSLLDTQKISRTNPTMMKSPDLTTPTVAKNMPIIGLVTDIGSVNDGTFNQYAFDGLKKAEAELGIGIKYIETQAQSDYDKNIQSLVDQNCELIVAIGFMMGDAIHRVSENYPDTKFAIVDFAYDPALPNVRGLVFAEDQAGYMAGALAASMTQSGTIAAVGGIEVPPVQKFLRGYEVGAKSINPDVTVKSVYIESFVDRARGAEAAMSFMAEGADVIFGAGGQTGSGGIQYAAEQGIYVIGVDTDEYVTTFQNGSAPGADKIISSAIKRVDQAVFLTIKDVVDGIFTSGVAVYDASNGGIGLAPYHETISQIPNAVQSRMDEILQGLANGSTSTPSVPKREVIAISAGQAHSLALTRSGEVVAWGDNTIGQTNVPAGLIDVIQISAGLGHSLALTRSGEVVAWGWNQYNQTDVPSGLQDVVQVATDSMHSLALTRSGEVVAWGWNQYNQTDVPAGLRDVVQVTAGSSHSFAVTRSGEVVAWGNNDYGQTDVPSGLRDVVQVVAGSAYSLALKTSGEVVAWGMNDEGQTDVPAGLRDVVAVAAGQAHSLALTRSGEVVAWGDNTIGQTNVPAGLRDVVAVAAGDYHSLALTRGGEVVAWGNNNVGQTDVPLDIRASL